MPLPTDKIIDLIVDEIEPYEGGKLGLYELHRLDITDKHIVLIPTLQSFRVGNLVVHDAEGRQTSGLRNLTIIASHDRPPNSALVGTEPDDLIHLPAGRAVVLHGDPRSAFGILFGNDQPFARESVLEKLNTLIKNVTTALDALEREGTAP